jgi:hypothetical protein
VISRDSSEMELGASRLCAHGIEIAGELIYEYTPRITRVVEYGISAERLLSGAISPPLEGARIDFYLGGPVIGPRLAGTVSGVDYLSFRADGRADLHIHAAVDTDSGERIALFADGVAVPTDDPSIFLLRENVQLQTNYPELSWMNGIQVWAAGAVNVSDGLVWVRAYAV